MGLAVAEDEYDGLNRRTVTRRDTDGDGVLDETEHFYYHHHRLVESRVSPTAPAQEVYVWGPRGQDDLVLRERDTNNDGVLDERLFALNDFTLNVQALVDATGAVVERFRYSVYGTRTALDAGFMPRLNGESAYDFDPGYQGLFHDDETGFINNRRRLRHAELGVWLTRDPIGYEGGLNLYEIAQSQPNTLLDPSGLKADRCDTFGKSFSWETPTFFNRILTPIGFEEASADISYSAEICDSCCDDGSEKKSVNLSFSVGLSAEVGSPGFDVGVIEIRIGWFAAVGGGGSGSISIDQCGGGGGSACVGLSLQIGGRVKASLGVGDSGLSVVGRAFLQGNGSACITCTSSGCTYSVKFCAGAGVSGTATVKAFWLETSWSFSRNWTAPCLTTQEFRLISF